MHHTICSDSRTAARLRSDVTVNRRLGSEFPGLKGSRVSWDHSLKKKFGFWRTCALLFGTGALTNYQLPHTQPPDFNARTPLSSPASSRCLPSSSLCSSLPHQAFVGCCPLRQIYPLHSLCHPFRLLCRPDFLPFPSSRLRRSFDPPALPSLGSLPHSSHPLRFVPVPSIIAFLVPNVGKSSSLRSLVLRYCPPILWPSSVSYLACSPIRGFP